MTKKEGTMTKHYPAIYSVAEYEDGWFVEMPDPIAPLHSCKFIQVAGPYKSEQSAIRRCKSIVDRRHTVMTVRAALKKARGE